MSLAVNTLIVFLIQGNSRCDIRHSFEHLRGRNLRMQSCFSNLREKLANDQKCGYSDTRKFYFRLGAIVQKRRTLQWLYQSLVQFRYSFEWARSILSGSRSFTD